MNVTLFHALITSIALFVTIFKTWPSICSVCLFLGFKSSMIMIVMMILLWDLA